MAKRAKSVSAGAVDSAEASGERLAAVEAEISEIAGRLLNLEGLALAILRRQVVNLDQGFAGVRSPMGWLILPREEFPFLLHFADGTSGHEPGTIALLKKILRPGDVAVDVGAHIGLLSLPMAQMVRPNGRIIAVEPNPRSLECLRRTLTSNLLSHLADFVEVAASDEDATTEFHIGVNSMMGSLVVENDPTRKAVVQTARLDSLIPAGSAVDFVKIDVEGAELRVLSGMRRIIEENPDILLIAEYGPQHLRRAGVSAETWVDALAAAGLHKLYAVDEATGECTPIDVARFKQLEGTVNVLCSRSGNPRLSWLEQAGDQQVGPSA